MATAGPSKHMLAPSSGDRAYPRSKGTEDTERRGTDRGQLLLMGTPSWQSQGDPAPHSLIPFTLMQDRAPAMAWRPTGRFGTGVPDEIAQLTALLRTPPMTDARSDRMVSSARKARKREAKTG